MATDTFEEQLNAILGDESPRGDDVFDSLAAEFAEEPDSPKTYKELRRDEYDALTPFEKVVAGFEGFAQGVAYGDNILANTIRLITESPADGETEEQFSTRRRVEAEIRDTTLLDSNSQVAGSILSDVGLAVMAAPLIPMTLPAIAAEGAATVALSGGLSRAVRGQEQTVGAVATDAAVGGALGAASFGAFAVGKALWNKAMKKTGATEEDLVLAPTSSEAVKPNMTLPQTQPRMLPRSAKTGGALSRKGARRVLNAEAMVKRAGTKLAKEAKALQEEGLNATAAIEQAAVREGLLLKEGLTPDDVKAVAKISEARLLKRAKRVAKRNKTRLGSSAQIVDKYAGQINQRVKGVSYRVGNSLERMEGDMGVLMGEADRLSLNLKKSLDGLGKAESREANRVLISDGPDAAKAYIKGSGSKGALGAIGAIDEIVPFMSKQADTLFIGAKDVTRMENGKYWPRALKELDSEVSDENIIMGLQGRGIDGTTDKTGNLRERRQGKIEAHIQDDYLDASDSFYTMAESSIRANTKRQFFGRDLSGGGGDVLPAYSKDPRQLINELMDAEVKAGRLLPENTKELGKILQARMIDGEKPTGGVSRAVADVTRMSLLGQWSTVMVQVSDFANVVAIRGIRAAADGIWDRLPHALNTRSVGLGERQFMEISGRERSGDGAAEALARMSNGVMKFTGMQAIDQAFTGVGLRAGRSQIRRQLRSKKGTLEFMDEMAGFASTNELLELLPRLREGVVDMETASIYFAKQMEIKPISRSQTTEAFSDTGIIRLASVLKSFVIQQMGITRRMVVDKALDGNKAEAALGATKLVLAWTAIGVPVSSAIGYLKGEEVDVTDEILDNALVHIGISKFVVDKAADNPVDAFAAVVGLAPLSFASRLVRDGVNTAGEEGNYILARNIPIVGSIIDLATGGLERNALRGIKAAEQEEREELGLLAKKSWVERRAEKRLATEMELAKRGL